MSGRGDISRILNRLLTVSKEDLESTYIISGQPLSAMPSILGLSSTDVNVIDLSDKSKMGILKTAISEREMHLQEPLSKIAEPLGLEVKVHFYEISGIPVYFVEEPQVTDLAKRVYTYIKMRISETGLGESDILARSIEIFKDVGIDAKFALSDPSVKAGIYYVWRDLIGYGPLEIPMEDPQIEEISWFEYDGPVLVVDKEISDKYPNAEFTYTNLFIPTSMDESQKKYYMAQVVRIITNKARTGLTIARPLVEARIPDPSGRGFHRLASHLDIVGRSTGLTIRKFPHVKLSLTKLIQSNTLSELEASYLLYQLINRGFILIVGAMASGKSVSGDSKLIFKYRGKIYVDSIENLWNKLAEFKNPLVIDEIEIIENPEIEILSLGKKAEWHKPARLIRHRYKGQLYNITTEAGTEIAVTSDHSLLTIENGKIEVRKPEEIKMPAYLPKLANFDIKSYSEKPENGFDDIFNLPEDGRIALLSSIINDKGAIKDDRIKIMRLSKEMAYRLMYAFASIGISANIVKNGKAHNLEIPIKGNTHKIEKFINYIELGKKKKILHRIMRYNRENGNGKDNKDIEAVAISKMEKIDYDGYVYDLEVPETENFEINGIFVHNTTLLQALISALPVSYKVITIEDTPELSTPAQNWHAFYTRTTSGEKTELENIDYSRLTQHSLRHRGTIVTLGEVRGAEMSQLIQASASGHGAICLRSNAKLLTKDSQGNIEYMTIKEVYDAISNGKKLQALSLNFENSGLEWKDITKAIKITADKWVKIRTASGRELETTEDHRLPVIRNGNLIKIPAGKLANGDKLIIASKYNMSNKIDKIVYKDVIVHLNRNLGYLAGDFLIHGELKSTRASISNLSSEEDAELDYLERLFRISTNKGDGITIIGKDFINILELIENLIITKPVLLPEEFSEGFYDAIKDDKIISRNRDLLLGIHIMLKNIGIESAFDGNSLILLGKSNADFITDEIIGIEKKEESSVAYDIEVADNHTFIVDSSIVSMNCTFHSDSPETTLRRIVSPPISASPNSLELISAIVHISRAKTYVEGEPKAVRRILHIYEIEKVEGENVTSKIVFAWNPATDSHVPNIYDKEFENFIKKNEPEKALDKTITALARLWNTSKTTRTLGYAIYGDIEPQRALIDILEIAKFLYSEKMRGVYDISNLLTDLTEFYLKLDERSMNTWKKIGKPLLNKIDELKSEKQEAKS